MGRYFYDIETNGLYTEVSQLHSICLRDMNNRELNYSACRDQSYVSPNGHKVITLWEALNMMATADELCGHNILAYDEQTLRKLINQKHIVFPGIKQWSYPVSKMTDTMVLSRLGWTDMRDADFRFIERFRKNNPGQKSPISGKLIGSHGLKAWGYRLKILKGDFAEDADWSRWTPDMQTYCEQDVEVTAAVYDRCRTRFEGIRVSIAIHNRPEWITLEHQVLWIVGRQMNYGFYFDVAKATELEEILQREYSKEHSSMLSLFKPWYSADGEVNPKRKRRAWIQSEDGAEIRKYKDRPDQRGWYAQHEEDQPYTKVKLNVFNPTSRPMIVNRLGALYGWKPTEYTDGGQAKVDDTILMGLSYPPARSLAKLFMLDKRLGMLATGKQAWLKAVESNQRIHGYVNTLGAVTSRMTHAFPNVAQVPSIQNAKGIVPYGKECRSLFTVPKGYVLVGGDASSLELVCLAHYMAKWDEGVYAASVSTGTKEEGTDPHTLNQKAAGLPSRDNAKTFIYAFLYGAGDLKIGTIVLPSGTEAEQKAAGAKLKKEFLAKTPALANLIKAVKAAAKRGWIKGLDGRRVVVRSQHAALNTLLQHTGAIIMKKALVILDDELQSTHGLIPGVDYEFVANVHDEFQIETKEQYGELVGQAIVDAIEATGEHFKLRCPVTGDFAVGKSWAETH